MMCVAVQQHNIPGHSRQRTCVNMCVHVCPRENTGYGFGVGAGGKYVGKVGISICDRGHGYEAAVRVRGYELIFCSA